MIFCCAAFGARAADGSARTYGPVQVGESLYRIALETRHPGLTAAQMMMAIFERNPQAFHQNNINRLKVGSTLQIPPAETARKRDSTAAYNEATEQIDEYEREVRSARVERGELPPLGDAPRDPEISTGITVTLGVNTPSESEIAAIKQGLQQDQALVLPEPKAPQREQRESDKPLFLFSYEVAYIDDDNVRLARDDDDIREDSILSATLKAKGGMPLDDFSLFNYGGSVTYNKYDTFDTLDNVEFEVNARYRFALTSGFTSPIYSLRAKVGGVEHDNSEMRDSTLYSLSAELNKWLTTTINMTAGLGLNRRESVSEVYDTQDARLFVNFDTNFTDTDLVYTTFTYITGDTVSSATPSLDIINAADAIEPDDAFGGVDANQFAYRIDSNTLVLTLGYNRILTPDLSLDLSARFVDSEAKDDDAITYERTIIRASLLGRF